MKTSKNNHDEQTVVDKGGNARIEVNINANGNNEPKKKRGFKRGAVVGTLGGIFLGGAGAAYAIENDITMNDIEDGVDDILNGFERGFNAAINNNETTSNSEQTTAETAAAETPAENVDVSIEEPVAAETLTSEDVISAIHETLGGEQPVAEENLTSEDVINAIHGELNVETEAGLNVLEDDFGEMSFDDAFAAARAEAGGPGGVFEWKGGLYGTYLADEWNEMSDDAKAEYGAQVRDIVLEHEFNANNEVDPVDDSGLEVDPVDDNDLEVDPVDDGGIEVDVVNGYNITDASGNEINISVLKVDGQKAALIDQDGDGQFEKLLFDENQDGVIDDSDVFEIQNEGLMVDDVNGLIDDVADAPVDMVDDVDFMA